MTLICDKCGKQFFLDKRYEAKAVLRNGCIVFVIKCNDIFCNGKAELVFAERLIQVQTEGK